MCFQLLSVDHRRPFEVDNEALKRLETHKRPPPTALLIDFPFVPDISVHSFLSL